jgi:hypothetical protein
VDMWLPIRWIREASGLDDGWHCCLAMRRLLRTIAPGTQAAVLAVEILDTGFLSNHLGTGLQWQARVQEFSDIAGRGTQP